MNPDFQLMVDVSDWQGPLEQSELELWRRHGVRYAMVRSTSESYCDAAVAAFRRVDITVLGLYTFLYWGPSVGAQVQYTIRKARQLGVSTVVLDCEHTPVGSRFDILRSIDWGIKEVRAAGLRPMIYTGEWWWRGHLGNPSNFGNVPLWHSRFLASYQPALREVSFGGWSMAFAHQFTSTPPPPFRRSLDLSYVFTDEEDDMTDDDIRRIVREEIASELRRADLIADADRGETFPTWQRGYEALLARIKAIHRATDPARVPD